MASNAVRRLGLTLLLIATLAEFAHPAPVIQDNVELPPGVQQPSVLRIRRQQHFGRRNQGNRPGAFRPGGGHFGSSSGIANAQAFENSSPLGSFGASAANAGTQSVNFRPGGFSGTAGQSMSQNYQLPGGGSASVSLTGGVSVDSMGGTSQSGGSSVAINRPNRPVRPIG